ncbi:MAG: glycosyltransferase family 39 protein, partial [bacterium]
MDGEVPAAASGRRGLTTVAALLLVGAAWAALQLTGLGRAPFHTRGEPREAVVVQQLVASGDWILPRRNASALPRKPPLFYWLGAAVARVRGVVDETTVRLPSALLSGGAALALTAAVALSVAPLAGAAAGLVLLTSFEWLRAATAARVDMTLAFGLTLAFVGLLRFRLYGRSPALVLFYVGVAWATLAKGIPGLAIPLLQVALLCLVDRSLALLRQLRPLRGVPLILLVVGAWYAAATAQGGKAFLAVVASENLQRIGGAAGSFAGGHQHSAGYLAATLLAGLLPWTLLLPAVGLALWRERATLTRTDPRLFALLWSLAVFTPHAIAVSKRGVYLLPLYPAVALLLGWWAARAVAGAATFGVTRRLAGVLGAILALLLSLLALGALAQSAGLPLLDGFAALASGRSAGDIGAVMTALVVDGRLFGALLGLAAAAALLAAVAAPRRWVLPLLGALVVCAGAVALAVRLVVMPAIARHATRQPFVAALRAGLDDPAALHTVPSLDYGTLFYWGAPMP